MMRSPYEIPGGANRVTLHSPQKLFLGAQGDLWAGLVL